MPSHGKAQHLSLTTFYPHRNSPPQAPGIAEIASLLSSHALHTWRLSTPFRGPVDSSSARSSTWHVAVYSVQLSLHGNKRSLSSGHGLSTTSVWAAAVSCSSLTRRHLKPARRPSQPVTFPFPSTCHFKVFALSRNKPRRQITRRLLPAHLSLLASRPTKRGRGATQHTTTLHPTADPACWVVHSSSAFQSSCGRTLPNFWGGSGSRLW